MDITTFLALLMGLSAVSGVITEIAKKLYKDKQNRPTNLIAIIIGVIVGVGGTHAYLAITGIGFGGNMGLYSALMGVAAAVSSMVGYDKVKQLVNQISTLGTIEPDKLDDDESK